MRRLVLLGALLTAPYARAAHEPALTGGAYLEHAKALIEPYLRDKGAEYGVDLTPDPNTWTVRRPYPELLLDAVVTSTATAFVNADELVSAGCREVTVELPARAARARFYVLRTPTDQKSGPPTYRLVGSCRTLKDPAPRMRIESLSTSTRRFSKQEFAAHAAPLVENYLLMNNVQDQPDWTSVRVRSGRSWFTEFFTSPVDDCRALEVKVGRARTRVYVSVLADESRFAPEVPMALQSLLKDPVSLRTYRFAVVRGCSEADQARPPRP